MAYTIPADNHAALNPGHTTDHNNIADMLTLNTQYNVKNTAYSGGAAGNGVADDTLAIQAALTACRTSAYGGVVIVPPGIYLVSNILQIGSNTTLMGAGHGVTTIRMKSGSWSGVTQIGANAGISCIQVYNGAAASNIVLQGITFDGNETGVTAIPAWANSPSCGPINLLDASNLLIKECQVINAIGYSLYIYNCTDFLLTGNSVLSGQVSAAQGWGTPTQQDGIHVSASQDGAVTGNIVDTGTTNTVGDDAIALQSWGSGANAITNVSVTGNTVIHAAAAGVDLANSGGPITNVSVTGNNISNTVHSGVKLSPYAGASGIISNVAISGNVFNNTSSGNFDGNVELLDYTVISSTGAGWGNVAVTGNSFANITAAGISLIYAGQGNDLTIADNTVSVANVSVGVQVGNNAEPVNGFSVTGNTIDMSASSGTGASGIVAFDSKNGTISGNTIIGDVSASGSYGITLQQQTDACTGISVTGNAVTGWVNGLVEYNAGGVPNYNSFLGNTVHGCTVTIATLGANTYAGGQQLIQATSATSGTTGTASQNITGLVASLDIGTYYAEIIIPWEPTGTVGSHTTWGLAAGSGLTLSAISMGSLITTSGTTSEAGTSALVTSTTLSDAMWTGPTVAATAGYGQARIWGTLTVSAAGTLQMVFANATSADTVTIAAGATMLIRPLS